MFKKKFYSISLLASLISSCSDLPVKSDDKVPLETNPWQPVSKTELQSISYGMSLIKANGYSFAMGDPEYQSPIKISFTYDFLMDKTEISEKEYYGLMQPEGTRVYKSYPITRINQFEAMLYCNKRSIAEGLDTVYSYDSISYENVTYPFPTAKMIYGLKSNIHIKGYRLPTQAEWEYACRGGTTTNYFWGNDTTEKSIKAYAWYNKNASEKSWTEPHAEKSGNQIIGTKNPNPYGLYDMVGNVAEFILDYYDKPNDISDTDPIGSTNSHWVSTRGGHYYSKFDDLRSGIRGGVFSTISSTEVGFRCVLPLTIPFSWLKGQHTHQILDTSNYILINPSTYNQVWQKYSFARLSWLSSSNIKNISVYYKTGQDWVVIDSSVSNTGYYSLDLSNIDIDSISVKISDVSSKVNDTTKNIFLHPLPFEFCKTFSCDSSTVAEIYQLNGIDSIDLRYYKERPWSLGIRGKYFDTLPPQIGKLRRLSHLAIDRNNFMVLPKEIGQLANLRSMYLYYNKLTKLPPEIGYLTNIRELSLYGNSLVTIPPEFSRLKNLTNIQLSINKLRYLPNEIATMEHISILDVGNNLLEMIPLGIYGIEPLERLDIGDNYFNELPEEIGNLENLKSLNIAGNRIEVLPSSIGRLKKLEYLNFSANKISNVPMEIGNLDSLQFLGIGNNEISDIPLEITNLKFENSYITPLFVSGNHLCNISDSLRNWINTHADSTWEESQRCD